MVIPLKWFPIFMAVSQQYKRLSNLMITVIYCYSVQSVSGSRISGKDNPSFRESIKVLYNDIKDCCQYFSSISIITYDKIVPIVS